ncbi:MAG: pseudouridine synthase family protein [Deltaproteobacteria bacterium]
MSQVANQPPSIHHLICDKTISLSEFVRSQLHIDHDKISLLISLGSLFVNKERRFQDSLIHPLDYVRVHPYPKRYPVNEMDWNSRILFQNDQFVLVNKPAGIPVHATLDNAIENTVCELSRFLNIPLYVTQRLDVPVSGLLILAKTQKFQSEFNRLLIKRKLDKKYHAVTLNIPPLGLQTHYMEKSLSAPKKMHHEPSLDRLHCQLEILNTQSHPLGYLNEIKLITGRTHQIRAQLALLNCPILGDTPYNGHSHPKGKPHILLQSTSVSFNSFSFSIPPSW